METKEIIEQIHKEFRTEGDRLLEIAMGYLTTDTGKDHDKGLRLAAVGFKQAIQGKEALALEEDKVKAFKNAELLKYYSMKYPLHRFIDEAGIKRICNKYSLVFTTSDRYTGFVPEKNLREIENFKNVVKDKDKELLYEVTPSAGSLLNFSIRKGNKIYSSEDTLQNSFLKDHWFSTYADRKELGVPYDKYFPNTIYNEELWICAPVKDINMQGMEIEGHKLKRHIPDPVVLYPVKGGFLIVTMWADETHDPTSDPELYNPINN